MPAEVSDGSSEPHKPLVLDQQQCGALAAVWTLYSGLAEDTKVADVEIGLDTLTSSF